MQKNTENPGEVKNKMLFKLKVDYPRSTGGNAKIYIYIEKYPLKGLKDSMGNKRRESHGLPHLDPRVKKHIKSRRSKKQDTFQN